MEHKVQARAARGLGTVAEQCVDLVAYALELFYDLAIGTKTGLSVSPGFEAFTGAIAVTE